MHKEYLKRTLVQYNGTFPYFISLRSKQNPPVFKNKAKTEVPQLIKASSKSKINLTEKLNHIYSHI